MNGPHADNSATADLRALIQEPRESMDVEIKDWLDLNTDNNGKATIAKAILALANHGGGWVVVGAKDLRDGWAPSGECPHDLRGYTPDAINSIVSKYADPKFEVQTHHLEDRAGNPYVVIVVPGGHRVPIRSRAAGPDGHGLRKNTYYTRRPGPESAPIADSSDWDAVISRCLRSQRDTLAGMFREIARTMAGAEAIMSGLGLTAEDTPTGLLELEAEAREHLAAAVEPFDGPFAGSRFKHGIYAASYEIEGVDEVLSLSGLLRVLRQVQGRDTGWPMWLVPDRSEVVSRNGRLECFLGGDNKAFDDAAHSDFWVAEPAGRGVLLRGYQDDSAPKGRPEPGRFLDLTIPIWRAGELALHVHRLSEHVASADRRVTLRMTWDGLRDRELSAWASPNRFIGPAYKCMDETITSSLEVSSGAIPDTLPEIAQALVSPLLAAFDFQPDPAIYAQEIGNLRRRA